MKVVEINNLVKRYGSLVAVNNISLNIEKGSIYGLLGPNGAGKSTLINLITTVSHANEGEIKLFGEKVKSDSIALKERIGVVPQNLALYDDFTAYENLKFFGELYGISKQNLKRAIDEALDFVGLKEVKNKKVKTYSGGMKRRLNIACAIIHKPELIIMDEPTVGIDPQSRNHIIEGVRKLNKDGATIIYTTHYMEEAEALCNNISIIDKGRILAEGSPEELKNLINDKTTLSIKATLYNPEIKEEIMKIKGVETVVIDEDGKFSITSLRTINNLDQIISLFKERDIKFNDIGFKETNLEDVFLTLTGRRLRD